MSNILQVDLWVVVQIYIPFMRLGEYHAVENERGGLEDGNNNNNKK